jgi:hypothetical protein
VRSWPARLPDGARLTAVRRTRSCRSDRTRAKGGRAAPDLNPCDRQSQPQAVAGILREGSSPAWAETAKEARDESLKPDPKGAPRYSQIFRR